MPTRCDPKDPQLAFALASGYLRVKNVQGAERLFAQVAAARPSAQTYVLIGRTYRDFRFFEQARSALRRALKMDPKTPRAHYYLGTAAVMEEGVVKVDEAIAEFREELRIVPDDPPTTLRLGMALVEARRDAEALPLLQKATAVPSPSPDAWLYLGRCQLALGRAAEAIVSFRRALDTGGASRSAADSGVGQSRSRLIHYQLGTALRQTGAAEEAEREFAEAERLSAKRTETDRSELANYLADAPDANAVGLALALEVSGFEKLTPQQRTAIASTVRGMLARAYLNLGIVHAQAHRFDRAAELFELAAEVEPAFPQVQYSLGVAYFNSKQYAKAAAALERALEQAPGNGDVRRMLALAALNAEDYAKAADLLRDDPRRSGDPSLQYAYGIALVQSNRAEEAQVIFTRIVNEHPDVAEVNVVLGQAYAAQGDYEAAVKSLNRAIELKPTVAEAQASLGLIYLQQGKLPEAAAALRAELTAHPDDVQARYTLATVLDLQSKPDEATAELQVDPQSRPPARKRPLSVRQGAPLPGIRRCGGRAAPIRREAGARRSEHPLPARPGVSTARTRGAGGPGVRSVPPAQRQEARRSAMNAPRCAPSRWLSRCAPPRQRVASVAGLRAAADRPPRRKPESIPDRATLIARAEGAQKAGRNADALRLFAARRRQISVRARVCSRPPGC